VPLQRVPGQIRVVEVILGPVPHAEPVHHPPRPPVVDRGEGDDLRQSEHLEAVGERQARGLGRIAVSPGVARQPPAHLDAGGEMRLEPRPGDAGEADAAPAEVDRPQAPATLVDPRLQAGDHLRRDLA